MKSIQYLTLVVLCSLLFTVSCKKEEDDPIVVEPKQDAADEGSNDETARNEYDNSLNAIYDALNSTGLQTGKTPGNTGVILPCGVIRIDSSGGVYTFVYDNTLNCGIKVLSGSISARMISGSNWSDVGATIQFTYTNYKIKFITNNQTIEINGPLNITNKSGGRLYEVLSGKSITHTTNGTVQITFDANDTRPWTISKKRTYESTDNTIAGLRFYLDSDGPYAEVGSSRNGTPFTTTFQQPIVFENCSALGTIEGPFIAKTGKVVFSNSPNSMTVEPGYTYNIINQTLTQVNDCNSRGYKLTYDFSGTVVVKFQYY